MKSVFNVISMAAVLLLANSSSTSQAVVLESAHKTHNTKVYDPAPFKQMFAQIDTEIEQVQRNKDQGVIGRQLGLTKVVSMKMHVKDLYKDILNKIKLVQEEVQDGDYAKATAQLNVQLDNFNTEGKKIASYVPKIEVLERDLELLDTSSHDEELAGLSANIDKLVQSGKHDLNNKKQAQQKKEVETK